MVLKQVQAAAAQEADAAARAAGVRQALGSLAMEGLVPSDESRAVLAQFVAGEISGDEMEAALAHAAGIPIEDL